MNRKFDLEERLVDFAVGLIKLSNTFVYSSWRHHIVSQLIRAGNSAALNYGEAQGAQSKRDFIHKLRLVLKELREVSVCLKIIAKAKLSSQPNLTKTVLEESFELIAIFVSSLETLTKGDKITNN